MSIPGKPAVFLIFVIAITCLFSTCAFAQNQGQRANSSGPTVVAPPVYVVAGGYGTYLAPSATLPAQSTGISLSNVSGISLNAPLQTGVVTAVPATAGWANGTRGYGYGYYGYPTYSEISAVPTEVSVDNGAEESGRAINDLAPSYFLGASESGSGTGAPSLGEIAARYKAQHRQNVRMYTNADAERLMSGVKSGSRTEEHIPR